MARGKKKSAPRPRRRRRNESWGLYVYKVLK